MVGSGRDGANRVIDSVVLADGDGSFGGFILGSVRFILDFPYEGW